MLTKVILRVLALICFLAGAAFLPFYVWAVKGQGSNPALGWVIYLSSVLIPWGIGFWLVTIAQRASNKRTPPTE